MNRELNLIAIDRENIIWKQNHSMGGSSVVQNEPECLTHGGCSETPPPPLPRGTVTPSKYGAANCEADPGPPTSTRTVHPILDPHELMSCRLKHLAAIQAEMSELARLVEARNHLFRQTELCRSFLETGQMLSEGQQRLEQVVQMREQLEAEIIAQHLRLAEVGREIVSLNDRMAAALNAKLDMQSAALDKIAERLAVHTRVAEEALQPLIPPKMSGDVGPSDRGMIDGSSSMQGSANAFAAGSEAERADEPPVAPMSEWGMHTLEGTTADTVTADSFGTRHVAGLTAHDLDTNVLLASGWGACTNEGSGTGMPHCSGKGMSCADAIARTHRPNGSFIVRHATSVFQIAEKAACGLVTSDCKSTSTASAHLHRFSDSSPRTDDDGELTEKGMVAAEAYAVVRYSTMHMASIQSDRRRLLAVTEDYG
jgi:hypothetical protein